MPWKPATPCTWPGCKELVNGKYSRCVEHRVEAERNLLRGSAAERGYGTDHRKIRGRQLRKDPLCAMCGKQATVFDHIVPKRFFLSKRAANDPMNRQSLCASCHGKKTVLEDGGFGRKTENT